MTLSERLGALKRFRRIPWRFQKTFHTPSNNLRSFVTTILSSHESIQSGCAIIDQVIFEPRQVKTLLAVHSLPVQFSHDYSIAVTGRAEVVDLLEAAFADSVEFIFVPSPKPFVIYADHDEYVTFYANTKSNLNSIVNVLTSQGFKSVEGYQREM